MVAAAVADEGEGEGDAPLLTRDSADPIRSNIEGDGGGEDEELGSDPSLVAAEASLEELMLVRRLASLAAMRSCIDRGLSPDASLIVPNLYYTCE